MTVIVDSGPIVALGDRRDQRQRAVQALLEAEPGSLIVPLTVATEVEYILRKRASWPARLAFVEDLADGRFMVECLTSNELVVLRHLALQYAHLDAGLTDLSVVILAARFGTDRVVTFDQRDFRVLRPLRGSESFQLLPELISGGGAGPRRRLRRGRGPRAAR